MDSVWSWRPRAVEGMPRRADGEDCGQRATDVPDLISDSARHL